MKEKKPTLYVKGSNGRYEVYRPQEPKYDNALYRKVGNKYYPCSMQDAANGWNEGVYAVVRNGSHIIEANYMRNIFSIYKCADIEHLSIARLGGMVELTDHLCHHWHEIKGDSIYEKCASIVSILMNYCKDEQQI